MERWLGLGIFLLGSGAGGLLTAIHLHTRFTKPEERHPPASTAGKLQIISTAATPKAPPSPLLRIAPRPHRIEDVALRDDPRGRISGLARAVDVHPQILKD